MVTHFRVKPVPRAIRAALKPDTTYARSADRLPTRNRAADAAVADTSDTSRAGRPREASDRPRVRTAPDRCAQWSAERRDTPRSTAVARTAGRRAARSAREAHGRHAPAD